MMTVGREIPETALEHLHTMRPSILATVLFCAVPCLFTLTAKAQQRDLPTRDRRASVARKVGTEAMVVVATTGRVTYKTAKFVVKDIAEPVAVHVIGPAARRAMPPVGRFVVRNALRIGVPLAVRLSLL